MLTSFEQPNDSSRRFGPAVSSETLDGTITQFNDAAADLFGWSPAEAIGQPVQMLIPDDGRAQHLQMMAAAAAGLSVEERRVQRRRRDGTTVDVLLTFVPIRGPDGTVVAISSVVNELRARLRRAGNGRAVMELVTSDFDAGAGSEDDAAVGLIELDEIDAGSDESDVPDVGDDLSPANATTSRDAVLAELAAELATAVTSAERTLDIAATRMSVLLAGPVALHLGEERRTMRAVIARPESMTDPFLEPWWGIRGTLVDQAVRHRRATVVSGARLPGAPGSHIAAVIPLVAGESVIGCAVVGRRSAATDGTAAFDDVSLGLATDLADVMAVAVRNSQLLHSLQARTAEAEDDAAELRRTVQLLAASDAGRRALLGRLVRAQDEERTRIAGEIHDDSLQVLAALGLRLQLLRRHVSDDRATDILDRVEETLVDATGRLRRLLFHLRPPSLEDNGLVAAVCDLAGELLEENEIRWRCIDQLDGLELRAAERSVLYRIIREAVTNVVKHAHARGVAVTFESRDNGVFVRVQDDGDGFDPARAERAARDGHLGLQHMREQAELAGGNLSVYALPGVGTTVEIWVPTEEPELR